MIANAIKSSLSPEHTEKLRDILNGPSNRRRDLLRAEALLFHVRLACASKARLIHLLDNGLIVGARVTAEFLRRDGLAHCHLCGMTKAIRFHRPLSSSTEPQSRAFWLMSGSIQITDGYTPCPWLMSAR
jgi:hypothetical protein